MSVSDDKTLEERVRLFQCMELPGQPKIMHMGTSYLVHDLLRRVQELERDLELQKESVRDLQLYQDTT